MLTILKYHKDVLADGLQLFKKLIGYPALYFVPPNGEFSNVLMPVLANHGLKYVYADKFQRNKPGTDKSQFEFHYLGQKNKPGLRYITRNYVFEPSEKSRDWVDACMSDINIALNGINRPSFLLTG